MTASMADPTAQAALAEVMQTLMNRPHVRDLYGMELVSAQVGQVTLALGHRPELGHLPGWFQGTVTSALAETAAAMSGVTIAPGGDTMTLQQSIHFTGSARGDRLVA
ncbi:MAG TPA: hypothetical protein VI199_02885, partial [Novosphingobium sp.]